VPKGRPQKVVLEEIQQDLLEGLAGMGATWKDIVDCSGMPKTTLLRNYGDVVAKGKMRFENRIRAKLLVQAFDKDNVACLIWLSKNFAGMSERANFELHGGVKIELIVKDYRSQKRGLR